MSARAKLVCVHGFLGLPADWQAVFGAMGEQIREAEVIAVDALHGDLAPRPGGLAAWAHAFNRQVRTWSVRDGVPHILLGYSLGGRLALHALLDAPAQWDAAIIVAAHPGLVEEAQRVQRRRADEQWAERFATQAWEPLIAAWNAQDVFGGRPQPWLRAEYQFARADLAGALNHWSLGRQESLHERIAQLAMPITWIVGAQDARFMHVARELALLARGIEMVEIADAVHRVPWENTPEFVRVVRSVLRKLGSHGPGCHAAR